MIIQRVVKGISGIDAAGAQQMLEGGILCRWWQKAGSIPSKEIPLRLNDRNLDWHQNRYDQPDPIENNERFGVHTPFVSTTAGTVERRTAQKTNVLRPAWEIGLRFATDFWKADGYLFYCYVFILGKKSLAHASFGEELRELNVYTAYSPFQVEGEILAKVYIPPPQIERAEFWSKDDALSAARAKQMPAADPSRVLVNSLFSPPSDYNNVRELLA